MQRGKKERTSNRPPAIRAGQELISQVLQRIGNPKWDLFLVGDGSGSGWAQACGWAATIVDRATTARRFFYGAMDCGSVNFAESMPYIQALTWFDEHYGKDRLRELGYLNVVILTDSQVVAQWGNRAMATEHADIPRKQLALYAGMRELRRVGYQCAFHWAPRMTTELNWAADLMAGLTRRSVIDAMDPAYIAGADPAIRAANAVGNLVFYDPETQQRLDPYGLNPDENRPGNAPVAHPT